MQSLYLIPAERLLRRLQKLQQNRLPLQNRQLAIAACSAAFCPPRLAMADASLLQCLAINALQMAAERQGILR